MTAQQVDEVDAAYVRDRALDAVAANLAPAPFLMLPFVVLISTLLRTETSSQRIGWWLIAAVVATLVGMLALHRYRTRRDAGITPVTRVLMTASFAAIGAVFGLCPWVGADSRLSVVLLYTIFPATASAVGCIVAAGRRDMYLAFLVPLVGISAASLAVSGSSHLRGLAALSVFYGVGLLVLAAVSCRCRRQLPGAIPALTLAAAALVAVQGALGALTVTLLLPFSVVTTDCAAPGRITSRVPCAGSP